MDGRAARDFTITRTRTTLFPVFNPERSEGTLQSITDMRGREKRFWVYIIASLSGTLYVGLTDNLDKRLREHQLGLVDGFTKRYKVHRLMYYEIFRDNEAAALREKQIKKLRRDKKVALFAKSNPQWKDLTRTVSFSWKDVLM